MYGAVPCSAGARGARATFLRGRMPDGTFCTFFGVLHIVCSQYRAWADIKSLACRQLVATRLPLLDVVIYCWASSTSTTQEAASNSATRAPTRFGTPVRRPSSVPQVDFVCVSYTRSGADVREVRSFVESVPELAAANVVAKVETRQALFNFRVGREGHAGADVGWVRGSCERGRREVGAGRHGLGGCQHAADVRRKQTQLQGEASIAVRMD